MLHLFTCFFSFFKAKYQDNLEFTQWLKAFYDQSGVFREDYDPRAVRARGKGGKKYNELQSKGGKIGGGTRAPMQRPAPRVAPSPRAAPSPRGPTAVSRPKQPAAPATSASTKTTMDARASRPLRERPVANEGTAPRSEEAIVADAELMKKNADLSAKVEDLEQAVLDIEKERDFYFEKLRQVEIMCQVHQEKGSESDPDHLVGKILKVLYATADQTIIVDDDGELVDASGLTPEELAEVVEPANDTFTDDPLPDELELN